MTDKEYIERLKLENEILRHNLKETLDILGGLCNAVNTCLRKVDENDDTGKSSRDCRN
ncbi:MAG: hypothetical protein J5617_03730 [Bacilli bacterium]|nr:hypothetical protein [Bacilli bacterium]